MLKAKHEKMQTAKDIWDSLQSIFGQPSKKSWHDAVKVVINARMKNGTSVREHVLKIIAHLNEAEIHGAQINEKTQVGMILETLASSFLPFTSNYFMKKLTINMTQLLNELQIFESINIGKQGEANIADREFSSSKNKKRKSGQNVSSRGKQKHQKKNKNKNKNKSNERAIRPRQKENVSTTKKKATRRGTFSLSRRAQKEEER